ncbi:MAG: aminotransferase class IV [Campylobacterales bacterium]|nr:aminotransferase class IV [Campylobacterales bacterium]
MKPNTLLETLRCEGGRVHHLPYHQQRVDRSLRILGENTSYDLSSLIIPPDSALYRCRFLYTPTSFSIEFHPYTARKISTLRLIHGDHINYPFKYVQRESLNALFDQRNGCDDVLIIKNNRLTDTTIANIALYLDGQWLTPLIPLLEGTTRARLIDEGKITTAYLTLSDARNATKIALMNAMMGWVEMENGIII